MTKSETISRDLTALLRARVAVLWIVTREEARVERHLVDACLAAKYTPRTWDCAQGTLNADGTPDNPELTDVQQLLREISDRSRRGGDGSRDAWILRDAPVWLSGPIGAAPLRALCNLARFRPLMEQASAQAVLIITPSSEVPPELSGHVTVVDWPIPDKAEIGSILDTIVEDNQLQAAIVNGKREAAIDAALGLTGQEAAACFSKSLVLSRTVDPSLVAAEKKRVISREKVLEWYDPIAGGLDAVGGLEQLKAWLVSRASAYTIEAREYGLQPPRGALLVGVPGCGKSLTAKCLGTAWGVPVIRLDLNALKSKFVGGSEENLRRVLKTIEAIGRCVVWIDEVEKALQGATSGSSDGGVSTDALGTVLSWMQERQGDAFVLMTANDVEALPPELMRAGRIDDVWFVDLPNTDERVSILQAALRSNKREPFADDALRAVAAGCERFSGAEIAALVPTAMYAAFADGRRPIAAGDLISAAKAVVPASSTNKEKLDKLRAWASGRARIASNPETAVKAAPRRAALDIS